MIRIMRLIASVTTFLAVSVLSSHGRDHFGWWEGWAYLVCLLASLGWMIYEIGESYHAVSGGKEDGC